MHVAFMWSKIKRYFKNNPTQLKVARTLLELGLSVGEDGKIYCGSIEISPTKMAKALDIDRRVVKNTVESILSEPELKEMFMKIKSAGPFFGDVAKQLGFGVIVITADPKTVGIVAKATALIADKGISIRQIIAEDPELFPEPKLTIVTEKEVPGEIIPEFLKIPGVKHVTIY